MKFRLTVIGKTKDKNLRDILEDYLERISHYFPCEMRELKDSREISTKDRAGIIRDEGKRILESLIPSSINIALDAKGKEFDTTQFAEHLRKLLNSGAKEINFIIGGPFGLSEDVKKGVRGIISLSKLTFTHEMSSVILLEQLYRAMTIIKGQRYHY